MVEALCSEAQLCSNTRILSEHRVTHPANFGIAWTSFFHILAQIDGKPGDIPESRSILLCPVPCILSLSNESLVVYPV
jgi:hypothetical protein